MVLSGRPLMTDWDRCNGKVDAVFRPSNMSPRELERGVARFADQFYSIPSIFDRLLCSSRVVSRGTCPAILATAWRSIGTRPSGSTTGERQRPEGTFAIAHSTLTRAQREDHSPSSDPAIDDSVLSKKYVHFRAPQPLGL